MSEAAVPLARLQFGEEERRAVERVLASGRLVQGPEVEAFEQELAENLSGTRYAVAVSSGTAALELAILALGIGYGDRVVTTPFTFAATANAALRAGAGVRFADIGDDLNLDPQAVSAAVDHDTKAVLPVHLYGSPANVDAMASIGLPVVEDAAQAHLASLNGRRVGSLGSLACFSFYPSKNMTTGEGGAVTTDDPELAEGVRVLRNQGMRDRYEYVAIGFNARMTEMAAAIGRVQLRHLPAWTEKRRRTASHYLAATKDIEGVIPPVVPDGVEPAWHLFTIRLDPGIDRARVVTALQSDGIDARVYYPHVLPDLAPYRDHPRIDAGAPLDRARAAAETVVSLPIHHAMREADVERVAHALQRAVAEARGHLP